MFQYYFNLGVSLITYFGVDLNHTIFFLETRTGPMGRTKFDLGASSGMVSHLGMDWKWSDNPSLNPDLRRWEIQTTVHLTEIDKSALPNILPHHLVFDVPLDSLTIGLSMTFQYLADS